MTDTTKMLELVALLSTMRDLDILLCVTRKLKGADILKHNVKTLVADLEFVIRYDDPNDDSIRKLADRVKKTHAEAMNALIDHSLQ